MRIERWARLLFAARIWLAVAAVVWLCLSSALAAEAPRVILLRGWFSVFSTGLDNLADDLKARGIDAEAHWHLYWSKAIADILRERTAGKTSPIALVGHSQGANNIIDIARALTPHNVNIDLLVTLAPLLQDPVPANVVRAINYYQSPGWGAPIAADRDFHGTLSNIDVSDDWTVFHISIDKSRRVQADILREIVALSEAKEVAKDPAVSRNLPLTKANRDWQQPKSLARAIR